MANWKDKIIRLLNRTEERVDHYRFNFKRRFNLFKPFQILPYLGYGTPQFLYLKARVLEETGVLQAGEADTNWRNLANMYRRFTNDELGGARVQARFQEVTLQVIADKEGFLDIQLTPTQPLDLSKVWQEIELELIEPRHAKQEQPVRATGYVIVPPATAEFGVISDIDDTVVQTGATSFLTMARLMFSNARSRLPFAGVSAFYRALQQGQSNEASNPLFYVSSSPWNLYDLLVDFFTLQKIPLGPLFLQNYGLATDHLFTAGHEKHKLDQIETILLTYPELSFILIGDSGQKDPEIYREVTRRHPNRIRAIYIRDVMLFKARDDEIQVIAKEVGQTGVEMLLVADTFTAALHAAEKGFIASNNLLDILAEKEKDAHTPALSLLHPET